MGYQHLAKKCGHCQTVKSVRQFYPSRRHGTHRRDGWCKECRREDNRARQAKRNKVVARLLKADPLYFRRKKLVKLYGITHDQYMVLHRKQRGRCAICRKPEVRKLYGKRAWLAVDHDHKTRAVRGLLCHRCNVALGWIEDAAFQKKATRYLKIAEHES